MNEAQFKELIKQLETLSKLITVSVLKDKTPTERIALLLDFGLKQSVIADLLGTKPNIVSAVKSNLEKAKKKGKGKTQRKRRMEEKGAEESGTNQPSVSRNIEQS